MAKFLRTSGISSKIEDIIVGAREELVIVSPYLKISNNLFERLKEKSNEGVRINFVYGKTDLTLNERQKIESLPTINLYYHEKLHAKCYYNENEMIITSMNLYEFSEKNNREMGVHILKSEDAQLFEDGVQETKSIIAASKKVIEYKEFIPANMLEIFGIDGIDELLLREIKKVYKRNFEIVKQGGYVASENFANNVAVRIYSGSSKWRIMFQFNNDLYDTLFNNYKLKIESELPINSLHWSKKDNCINIEINYDKHYRFFSSEDSLVRATIYYVGLIEACIMSTNLSSSSSEFEILKASTNKIEFD